MLADKSKPAQAFEVAPVELTLLVQETSFSDPGSARAVHPSFQI
jgi:hypothetical protein